MSNAILITGGLVSVEDGAKHDPADQYSLSRKVRVELKFDVAEGSDPVDIVAIVGDIATGRVNELLGRAASSTARTVTEDVRGSTAAETENTGAVRKRRTKAQIDADNAAAAAKAADPADMGGEPSPPAADPSDMGGATTDTSSGSSAADPADFDFDAPIEPTAPATTITDADLNAAVQKKNGELGDPPKIRNLIGSFNPDPTKQFQLRQIPAEQRADFIAKLEALAK